VIDKAEQAAYANPRRTSPPNPHFVEAFAALFHARNKSQERRSLSHFPQVLPGGKAVIFTFWTGPGWEEQHLAVHLLAMGERRVVVSRGRSGHYVSTGHLVYNRSGILVAVPFDLTRLKSFREHSPHSKTPVH
jgi:hypothetical protein